MNLLRKLIAEKRRPDLVEETFLEWTLIKTPFFHLSLICYTNSEDDDDFRPSENRHALLLLEGEYILVQQEDFYDEQMSGVRVAEVAENIAAPSLRVFEPHDLYHVELQPAKNYGDAMLDMPGWMNVSDVRFDTQSKVWFLAWGWSWKALRTSR